MSAWQSWPDPGLNVVIPKGHGDHLPSFFVVLCKKLDVFDDGRVEADIVHGLPHSIQEIRWTTNYIHQHSFLPISSPDGVPY